VRLLVLLKRNLVGISEELWNLTGVYKDDILLKHVFNSMAYICV
jgi:hypothetical protein